jgi:hypothetical protein
MSDLNVAHACVLSLALLTPFTLSPSVSLFHAVRMIQTTLMGQYVLLHPKSNSKLRALLDGTPFRRIFYCTTWDALISSFSCFKRTQAVYVRFSHIMNFQPKFYIGSTSSFVLCREHSRYRKFLQFNRTNSCWPKLPYGFGAATTIFGCGQFYRSTQTNPTFGLWNKP